MANAAPARPGPVDTTDAARGGPGGDLARGDTMRQRAVSSLVGVYERVVNTGILDRPRAQRTFEAVYLSYKQLLEAGPVGGLERCVEDGTTVLDLGANIGFFS